MAEFNMPPIAASTITKLKQIFTMFGCPARLFTDDGRQFTAQDTQDFLRRWGVSHCPPPITLSQTALPSRL